MSTSGLAEIGLTEKKNNKDFKRHVSNPGTFISLEWKEFASLDKKLQAAIVHSFK